MTVTATETEPAASSTLEVRLARAPDEIEAAQRLRYRVFYEEMGAAPTSEMAAQHRDFDDFDAACDHLLVIDRARGEGAAGVVGTYRLQPREDERFRRFYTAGEYDVARSPPSRDACSNSAVPASTASTAPRRPCSCFGKASPAMCCRARST